VGLETRASILIVRLANHLRGAKQWLWSLPETHGPEPAEPY
jgi:hypothetical protein